MTHTERAQDRKIFKLSRCIVIDVLMVGPSTKSLARSIHLRCLSDIHYFSLPEKIAVTPTFLFVGSTKLRLPSPKDRHDEDEDDEEEEEENGDGERKRPTVSSKLFGIVSNAAKPDPDESVNAWGQHQCEAGPDYCMSFDRVSNFAARWDP
ncbi:hypothetical protein MVLG_03338 [Microbotryum lychnidis-dioicae p1A1 Lamole]|uniref:Uncharacterized protein n=1 Tax=Microbotryum lychnidis-dioicae (strain p1A1 Lamole / MvSl-1064) TaxID=683840 RepID=U5H7W8_USTV1|nr:hypothetical protein MVLG_03338 [Microbotryum lychnidis-dioicae p1A1 Lamole]|eukprot:KDE06298.1 hypothetical protein MVLG_03338 [Microbotryum lychnidis-dioicae p1A1 Lamole]